MRVDADDLAADLGALRFGAGPLYSRLASALAELIANGELPVGCQLPSERALAAATELSRTTVVAAYQHLRDDGLLDRREGSGTRVRTPRVGEHIGKASAVRARTSRVSRYLFGPDSTIDLATAALPGLDMVAQEAAAVGADCYRQLLTEHHGYNPTGLPALRVALAERHTSDGLETTPDQILITAGAQQAIEIISTGCLAMGDTVVVEQPAYRGALEVFNRAGCQLVGVPCDPDGLITTELERVLRTRPVRAVYVQSEVHNPTGARLSVGRRRRLAELAGRYGSLIIDDASLADTVFTDAALPPLAKNAHEQMIMVGSMNKLFWSGLRLGWIRASTEVIAHLAQMKGLADFGTSVLSQQVAVALLARIEQARAERRLGLTQAYAAATELIADLLPDWTWWQPRGGPSLWLELPSGDGSQFAAVALRFGVAVLPAAAFSTRSTISRHLRLPFALPEGRLHPGVERLAHAWAAYSERGAVHPPIHSVVT